MGPAADDSPPAGGKQNSTEVECHAHPSTRHSRRMYNNEKTRKRRCDGEESVLHQETLDARQKSSILQPSLRTNSRKFKEAHMGSAADDFPPAGGKQNSTEVEFHAHPSTEREHGDMGESVLYPETLNARQKSSVLQPPSKKYKENLHVLSRRRFPSSWRKAELDRSRVPIPRPSTLAGQIITKRKEEKERGNR